MSVLSDGLSRDMDLIEDLLDELHNLDSGAAEEQREAFGGWIPTDRDERAEIIEDIREAIAELAPESE